MSFNLENGYHDSIYGMLEGIVLSSLLVVFTIPDSVVYYPFLVPIFELGFLLSNVLVIFSFEDWKFLYLIGWISGQAIALYAGFLENWLFATYIVVLLVIIFGKAYKQKY